MRSINAALTAAQKDPSRTPYITAIIENIVGAVRRLDYAVLDTTSNAVEKHDVAVSGSGGAVHRIRMESGTVKYQRETSPGTATWSSWTNMATSRGTECAIAAAGSLVIIVYTDAANTTVYYRESINAGTNFGAETTLSGGLASAVTDLAAAYKSAAGDVAVFWTNAAGHVQQNRRVSGNFQGASQWSHSAQHSLNGIAAARAFEYELMITGKEVTSQNPTLWTLQYVEGAGTWSALNIQQQAHKDALTEFQAPFMVRADTWHANYVEKPSYTGGVTRSWRTWLHPSLAFTAGPFAWRTPEPHTDTNQQGVALACDDNEAAGYVYESAPALVQRAPRDIVTRDVSADVLAIDLQESTEDASCTLDLDNSEGQYAGPSAPVTIGNRLALSFGYYTTAGSLASRVLDLWITGYEYRRSGGKSALRLRLESGWGILKRTQERTDLAFSSATYTLILQRILNRAGMTLNTTNASSRAGSVSPVAYRIGSAESGYAALRRTLAFLADRVFMADVADANLTEPLTSDTTDYTVAGAHPLYDARLHDHGSPVAQLRVFAADRYRDVIDAAAVRHLTAPSRVLRDLSSTTSAAADNSGIAARRQLQLDEPQGTMIVPPICGLEPLDVIDWTDGLVSGSAIVRRVMAIRWRYDKRRSVYQQELQLGPV